MKNSGGLHFRVSHSCRAAIQRNLLPWHPSLHVRADGPSLFACILCSIKFFLGVRHGLRPKACITNGSNISRQRFTRRISFQIIFTKCLLIVNGKVKIHLDVSLAVFCAGFLCELNSIRDLLRVSHRSHMLFSWYTYMKFIIISFLKIEN